MSAGRPFRLTTGLLLAAPLVGIVAVLAVMGVKRAFGPGPAASAAAVPTHPATGAATVSSAATAARPVIPGLGEADGDFPPDRLWERVDGAADALVAAGCTRLLYWTSTDPKAEAEVLLFSAPDGAARTLLKDTGPDRTPGPGDEASVSAQAVFFRRGRAYVRVLGDALEPPDPARLLDLARKVDSGIPALLGGSGS